MRLGGDDDADRLLVERSSLFFVDACNDA